MSVLKVAVSARALFDLEESNKLFLKKGAKAFIKHTRKNQDIPLGQGVAFPLVKALLKLNEINPNKELVEIVVITSFVPACGIRILRSITHHELDINRSNFTGDVPIVDYLDAFKVDLLLTKSDEDAQAAVKRGIAAAIMYDIPETAKHEGNQIKIAFDGDAVLFSDESERIYKAHKLPAFIKHEVRNAEKPMNDGPFANVLRTINELQKYKIDGKKPFRLALVTARGGGASERVINTFDAWGIEIDELHLLSGNEKAGLLKAFRPHIFFDDQDVHVLPASEHVPAGRVPYKTPMVKSEEIKLKESAG